MASFQLHHSGLDSCTAHPPLRFPVQRLINRKVSRLVIEMRDPNPIIRGVGYRSVKGHIEGGIAVAESRAYIISCGLEDLNGREGCLGPLTSNLTACLTDKIGCHNLSTGDR